MRDTVVFHLGLLFYSLLFVISTEVAAQPMEYRVVVVGAHILPNKADGGCWDFCLGGRTQRLKLTETLQKTPIDRWRSVLRHHNALEGTSLPDAYALLRFSNGLVIRTHKISDSLLPEWGTTESIALHRGVRLSASIWDTDLQRDDLIGQRDDIPIPPHILEQGGTWTLQIGQVYALTLLFVPNPRAHRPRGLRAGLYEVTIRSAEIPLHNPDGKSWDIMNGKPDPYVYLRIGSHEFKTPILRNTHRPQWNATTRLYLTGREPLGLRILDHDGTSEETIGSCSFSSLEHLPFVRRVLLTLRCDRVRQLKLHFRRLR
ncbi:hypothetical protein L6R29_23690 [Myxococcota bacterium]|nr:hypothetical protein [Myxococcota bacterium]